MQKVLQISLISLLGLLFLIINGCIKQPAFPDTPIISLVSATQTSYGTYSDSFNFVLNYTDGNGDIGLDSGDVAPPFNPGSPYFYNLYVEYYEKSNGAFKKVPNTLIANDTVSFPIRMPVFYSPENKSKAIQGTISFGIFYDNPPHYSDTVMFQIYIYDRALNKSNVVQSQTIVRQ